MNQERDLANFDKLSIGALYRYQAYFGIEFDGPKDLPEKVESHFYDDLKIDEKVLLSNFLGLSKDSLTEDTSKRKSNRVKEKNNKKDYLMPKNWNS